MSVRKSFPISERQNRRSIFQKRHRTGFLIFCCKKRIARTGAESNPQFQKEAASRKFRLLFRPVPVTPLTGTEDVRFGLNPARPSPQAIWNDRPGYSSLACQ